MKKLGILRLIAVVLVVFSIVVLISPYIEGKTVSECYDEHERCKQRALSGNYNVFYTTLLLTACDSALPACLVLAQIH